MENKVIKEKGFIKIISEIITEFKKYNINLELINNNIESNSSKNLNAFSEEGKSLKSNIFAPLKRYTTILQQTLKFFKWKVDFSH